VNVNVNVKVKIALNPHVRASRIAFDSERELTERESRREWLQIKSIFTTCPSPDLSWTMDTDIRSRSCVGAPSK